MENQFDFYKEDFQVNEVINGKNCTFDAVFSYADAEELKKEIQAGIKDYSTYLASLILKHQVDGLDQKITANELIQTSILDIYIIKVLNDMPEVEKIYNCLYAHIDSKSERFLKSIYKYIKDEDAKLEKQAAKIKTLNNVDELVKNKKVSNKLLQNTQQALSVAPELTKMVSDTTRYISNWSNAIATMPNQYFDYDNQHFIQVINSFSEALSKLQALSLPVGWKERISENYLLWGEFGWSFPYHTMLLSQRPNDKKEADKLARSYFTKDVMEDLFHQIQADAGPLHKDCVEAIGNYKDKRYKSCALLLLSMIDGIAIRNQGAGKNDNKLVGYKAAEKVQGIISAEDEKKTIIEIARCQGTFKAHDIVFKKAENFKKQPEVINRNFLSHGMDTKRVRKTDCIQLFLLLYNWFLLKQYL